MNGLNVVIIGAGIGGLTAGIAMKQLGYNVQIYDRVRQVRPAGAGISLWSNAVKILNKLGLGEQLAAIGGEMNEMQYRTHKDELLNHVDLMPLFERVGQRAYPVARTDLQQLLLDAFGEEHVHFGMNCTGIETDKDSVTAKFDSGEQISGDVLIGADGVHSVIREYVLDREVQARYARYVNWNGLIDASPQLCPANRWVIYVGECKRVSMMPVGGGRFYYFFGAPMPQGTSVEWKNRKEELKQLFMGWPEPVQALIESLNPQENNRLEIADLDPVETLVRGRVCLLGDSGHASTPTLGQGGCQAMEDAEVLSRYLISTSISVEDALKRYELARKDRVSALTLKARKRAGIIYGYNPEATESWYAELADESPEDVINALDKVISDGPMG